MENVFVLRHTIFKSISLFETTQMVKTVEFGWLNIWENWLNYVELCDIVTDLYVQ